MKITSSWISIISRCFVGNLSVSLTPTKLCAGLLLPGLRGPQHERVHPQNLYTDAFTLDVKSVEMEVAMDQFPMACYQLLCKLPHQLFFHPVLEILTSTLLLL